MYAFLNLSMELKLCYCRYKQTTESLLQLKILHGQAIEDTMVVDDYYSYSSL